MILCRDTRSGFLFLSKSKMREIKTPLRYPGGKTRASKMLVNNMPEYKEYREPFIGGGSVFIRAKQSNPLANYWISQ